MGHRRKAREYALQGLYMFDINGGGKDEILSLEWVEGEIKPKAKDFAIELIDGTIKDLTRVDELLVKHLKNWKIERLDAIDRAILRMSIFSLLHVSDVPYTVTINEAIELGKTFGSDNSGHFINGILDAVKNSGSLKEN